MESVSVISPIVHLNGTGREELLRQRLELYHALQEVETKLGQASPNARDFYVEPGRWEKALAQHERRLGVLGGLLDEVVAEINQIEDPT